jgi:WD40 repeat protein
MQIFDLSSSTLVETIKAHTATLWSVHTRPDQQALVTGSADKDIKFWNIEWRQLDKDSVSTFTIFHPSHYILALEKENCVSGPHAHFENDGRHLVCSLQSQRKASGSCAARLHCQSFLSGYTQIFPFSLRSQGESSAIIIFQLANTYVRFEATCSLHGYIPRLQAYCDFIRR